MVLRTGRPLHPDCCRLKNDLEFDPGSHSVVLSFRATSQDIGLLHVYGYPRDGRRYFVSNPRTVDEGIQIAEDALKDRRCGFVRAEVKDIRAGEVVWHSDPSCGLVASGEVSLCAARRSVHIMDGYLKSCPRPVLTSDTGGVIWFHPSAIKAATMALPDCLHCGQPGRRLDHTSAIAWTDFYRCDGCGQVWSSDGPAKRRTAKIVIAPRRPGRRSGKSSH